MPTGGDPAQPLPIFCWNISGVEIQKGRKYTSIFSQAWLAEFDLPIASGSRKYEQGTGGHPLVLCTPGLARVQRLLSSKGPLPFQDLGGGWGHGSLAEDQAVEEESESWGLKGQGQRGNWHQLCRGRGNGWVAAELCGRFLFRKSCAEKNSTKCCSEKRKTNLKP